MVDEPLDAYQTAKPGEPHWTVQGGDPLGGPLLRLWAKFARARALSISHPSPGEWTDELVKAAGPAANDAEAQELLIRATKTEEVSWAMDAYLKGQTGAKAETPDEKLSVPERIDLHDLRVFAASRISGMFSELAEIKERLEATKFDGMDNLWPVFIDVAIKQLQQLHHAVEPAIQRQRYARKG